MKDLFQQTQESSQTKDLFIALSQLGVRVWKYWESFVTNF